MVPAFHASWICTHIFLLWLKSTTTKYLELPSAKGEEGSRDGDAERAST